ncbi:MAG TPA: hypothetical protein PK831_03210 [Candidatus Magasanikbacteria bacterium]|nr:hypothetical protein [Candidatus Magasanikbacteria bacterium]
MNIVFCDSKDNNIGSTRIWVNNLSEWLKDFGEDVVILKNYKDLISYKEKIDIIIFGKNEKPEKILNFSKQKEKIGLINPSLEFIKKKFRSKVDFIIVGSLEERDFWLDYYKAVFIFPLIEKNFTKKKIHEDKKEIVFGYHGNLKHLQEMNREIVKALEEFSKEREIILKVIYNKKLGKWNKNRPKIKIEEKSWNLENLEDELLKCDIGLVPGVINQKKIFKNKMDYLIKFKNKSNSGRCFVFHQLNIPVIADFNPSNFHILGNLDCGFVANSYGGWLNAMNYLSHSENRKKMADNAYNEFLKYYDPIKWTKRFVNELNNII